MLFRGVVGVPKSTLRFNDSLEGLRISRTVILTVVVCYSKRMQIKILKGDKLVGRVQESKHSFPLSPLCGVVCAACTPPTVTCDIPEARLPAWLTRVSSPSRGHTVWLKAPHPVNHIAGADCQADLRTLGSKVTLQANTRARSQTRPFSGTHGMSGPGSLHMQQGAPTFAFGGSLAT